MAGGLVLSGLAGRVAAAPNEEPVTGTLVDTVNDQVKRVGAAVLINGRGPFTFVVDTGANRTVICAEAAAALGLPPGPRTRVHGIAGPQATDTVQIRKLQIGTLKIDKTISAPLVARHLIGADGLLGIDVMRDQVATLDFLRDRLEISGRDGSRGYAVVSRTNDSLIRKVQARQKFGQLTILDAQAEGVKVQAFIDSGAQRTVGNTALREAVRARRPELANVSVPVKITGATGQTMAGELAIMPSMKIGGLTFHRYGAIFADLHTFALWGLSDQPAALIGMDVLRLFKSVTLDFKDREVRFHIPKEMVRAPRG